MNEFERRNLERLRAENEQARQVSEAIRESAMQGLRSNAERMAKILVWSYFDEGLTAQQVKDRLREDADIFEGLNLTDIINNEYQHIQRQREQLKVGRWSKQTQRAFGQWFARHRRASREGNIR